MALVFNRKGFHAGVIIVREPEVKKVGKEEIVKSKEYRFSPKDLGKSFEFIDESYILAKYPVLFSKAK